MKRRSFLKRVTALLAGSAVVAKAKEKPNKYEIKAADAQTFCNSWDQIHDGDILYVDVCGRVRPLRCASKTEYPKIIGCAVANARPGEDVAVMRTGVFRLS